MTILAGQTGDHGPPGTPGTPGLVGIHNHLLGYIMNK